MSINQDVVTLQTTKYSTQLPPQQIKWVKRLALDCDLRADYEVVITALDALRLIIDQEVLLPSDQLPGETRRVLDTLKAGKQETLFA
jgi:hypothetical protein